ncbi:Tfp pilus assembly protein PilN [Oxalobacteraceae bacterium GrIS 2.11]
MKTCAALHINFARRDANSRLAGISLWVVALALLGLVLLGIALAGASSVSDKEQSLEEALLRNAKKQEARRHAVASVKPVIIPEGRALAINAAIQRLNLPWSDVFDAIEEATPANIALISIEPDIKKQVIKGQAEALSSDDMIAYIEKLKKAALFVNVELIKHEVNQQDPNKPLRFEFEAEWKGTR